MHLIIGTTLVIVQEALTTQQFRYELHLLCKEDVGRVSLAVSFSVDSANIELFLHNQSIVALAAVQ